MDSRAGAGAARRAMTVFQLLREKLRSPGSETQRRWRRGAPRRSAGQSRRQGALLSCTNEFVQVALEAFTRPRGARVVREVRVVDAVYLRDAERPGAALRSCHRRYVHRVQYSRSEKFIFKHVAGALLFIGHVSCFCGVRDGGELPAAPDPDVAGFIGPARVEQSDVRRDGRHVKKRVCALGKRVLQHFPVRSFRQQVRTQNASQGHERHALFARLQRGVNRRAGCIAYLDLALLRCFGETRREPRFAQRDRARLDFRDAAGADQEIRRKSQYGNTQELESPSAPTDQGPHHFHRRQRVIRRQPDQRAVGDLLRNGLPIREKMRQAVPPTVRPSIFKVGWPTPTGTLCPSLPQVPMPESSARSLPIMLTRVSASGPLPISVAPFTGCVTLPSSIR